MNIVFVKKLLHDGSACRKCLDVEARLQRDGWMKFIDAVALAQENDPYSDGMRLAAAHGIDIAPFFVVTHDDGRCEAFTVYLRFVREVLEPNFEPEKSAAA
ncbi:MAG: hypothetical protein IT494_02880 [Gammaproteobacteria bacterium]|nr:hypothetical protein [Gammaproteobacteria bacterium]